MMVTSASVPGTLVGLGVGLGLAGPDRPGALVGAGLALVFDPLARLADDDHDDTRDDDAAGDDQPAPAPARPDRSAWYGRKYLAHRPSGGAGLEAAWRVTGGLIT